jgi:hypothetical protein
VKDGECLNPRSDCVVKFVKPQNLIRPPLYNWHLC